MEELLTLVFQNKDYIFLILFVYLLFYVLKTNGVREENYQSVIKELTEHIGIIKVVSDKVDKIETKVEEIFKKGRD